MVDREHGQLLDPFGDGPWTPPPGERPVNAVPQECPHCGSEYARPVTCVFSLSLLNSFLRPWLLNLHQCQECGEKFSLPGPRLRRFLIVLVPLGLLIVPILVAILVDALSQ